MLNKFITKKVKNIAKSLSVISIAFSCIGIMNIILNSMLGRFLKPEEYGHYSYIISISVSLIWILYLGNQHSLIIIDGKSLNAPQKRIESYFLSGLVIPSVLSIMIFCSILFFFPDNSWLPIYAIPISFLLGFIRYIQSIFQCIKNQWLVALVQALPIVMSIVFLLPLAFYHHQVITIIRAYCAILIASTIFLMILVGKEFNLDRPSFYPIVQMFRLGWRITVGTSLYLLMTEGTKLLIRHHISLYELGNYQAYYFSTVMYASGFSTILNIVFLPEAVTANKITAWKYYRKILLFLPIGLLFFGLTGIVTIWMYGYQFLSSHLFLFAVLSNILFFLAIFNNFMISMGLIGLKKWLIQRFISAFVAGVLLVLLWSSFTIYSLLIILIIAFGFELTLNIWTIPGLAKKCQLSNK